MAINNFLEDSENDSEDSQEGVATPGPSGVKRRSWSSSDDEKHVSSKIKKKLGKISLPPTPECSFSNKLSSSTSGMITSSDFKRHPKLSKSGNKKSNTETDDFEMTETSDTKANDLKRHLKMTKSTDNKNKAEDCDFEMTKTINNKSNSKTSDFKRHSKLIRSSDKKSDSEHSFSSSSRTPGPTPLVSANGTNREGLALPPNSSNVVTPDSGVSSASSTTTTPENCLEQKIENESNNNNLRITFKKVPHCRLNKYRPRANDSD